MSTQAPKVMSVEFINPFISAMTTVFEQMVNTRLRRGKIYLRNPGQKHSGLVAVIGMSGQIIGNVAIALSEPAAIQATARFVGMEMDHVSDEVVDCIGELVNMVAGNAKSKLAASYSVSLALPSVINGEIKILEYPREVTPICVPFASDIGDLMLQVGFVENN